MLSMLAGIRVVKRVHSEVTPVKKPAQRMATDALESPVKKMRLPVEAPAASDVLHSKKQLAEVAKRAAALMESAPPVKKAAVLVGSTDGSDSTSGEPVALSRLFGGLDVVLKLLASRGRRADLERVRMDVEVTTRKGLSERRLTQILAISGGMIDARWVGCGRDAFLELFQRVDDKARPPTPEEQCVRKGKFDAALEAVGHGCIPSIALPSRPTNDKAGSAASAGSPVSTSGSDTIVPNSVSPPRLATTSLVSTKARNTDAATRTGSMLARVRARAAVDRTPERACEQTSRAIARCESAMVAHTVVQSLFSRGGGIGNVCGPGADSATSVVEVVKALCSVSASAQAAQPLDQPAAWEAVDHLISKSACWFSVQTGVHVQNARYLNRLPSCNANGVMALLQAERRDLGQVFREQQADLALQIERRKLEEKLAEERVVTAELSVQSLVASPAKPPCRRRLMRKTKEA